MVIFKSVELVRIFKHKLCVEIFEKFGFQKLDLNLADLKVYPLAKLGPIFSPKFYAKSALKWCEKMTKVKHRDAKSEK